MTLPTRYEIPASLDNRTVSVPMKSLLLSLCLCVLLGAHGRIRSTPRQPQLTTFTTAGTFATGGAGSLTAAVADFNGDGIPDLATANLGGASVSVLLGSGNGTYLAPVNYTVGSGPYGIVVGDFNGDGRPDIAVANSGANTVSILLNAGNGVFPASATTYAVGSQPFGITVGDFNQDGRADLAVANQASNTVSVLRGNGDGTFQAATTFSIGHFAFGPVAGDLNGDGYPDLVSWNVADNTISVLLNDKTGSFLPQVTYATGVDPYGVALGDFNGDGALDIAVANIGGNTVSVLLNDRTGRFGPQTIYATGHEPTSVLAQDLNGDGFTDLFVTNLTDGTASILLGSGDGSFLPQTTMPAGTQPYAAASGDLDDDGKPDILLTNFVASSVAVMLQPRPAINDVTTYHFNNTRNGLNPFETTLTPTNVNATNFGKVAMLPTGGVVDASPLFLSAVTISGVAHNVVYVASEDDAVYAFDADSGTQLWKASTLLAGETTSDNHGCNQIIPQIGITSTPVIDRSQGPHGTIFVVAMSKDSAGGYHQRLHALDLTTGLETAGSPTEITGSYPGTGDNSKNGVVAFDPHQYAERVGLLLQNQTLYLAWTSHCDQRPYTGWVMAYSETTLKQTSIINLTPNGNEGAVWMAGAGLAGDTHGNVYLLDANGLTETTFDASGFPSKQDYGNAIVKLSTTGGTLAVADFFEPYNTVSESNADTDLGSGGTLLLPDQTDGSGALRHLLVGAGKDHNIYVADRDHLGKFHANDNSNLYQEIAGALPGGAWSMPAYFNSTVFYGSVGDTLRAFSIRDAKLATMPSSVSATKFGYPSATPSVSANGNLNGIVWALESGTSAPGVLHAYDARNLATELYNSKQAAGNRDSFGTGNKFITPMIVNGRVYVPTPTGVAVFGLLGH